MGQAQACRGKLYDGSPCLRDVVQGTGYCIFHMPDKEGELVERFETEFLREVEKQREAHPDYLDFTGFQFPTIVFFPISLPNIFLDNATFKTSCFFGVFSEHLENIHFTHIIEKTSITKPITFEGFASFGGATFEGDAGFSEATFEGDAGFGGATFKDAVFRRATFEGDAGFIGATFERYAGFREAKFEEYVSFNNTNFNGLTTFKQISVHKVIDITYTTISSLFNINVNQWIKDDVDDSIHLSLIKIRQPSFSIGGKIIITGNMGKHGGNHVSGISLIDSELKNVEFLDEQQIRLSPSERKMSVDEILLDLKTKGKIKEDDVSAANTAQLYRRLRDNYEEAKRYEEAGDWFLGEMEIRRKYDPSLATRALHTIYNILAKYGESVLLPFTWSILTISMTTIT